MSRIQTWRYFSCPDEHEIVAVADLVAAAVVAVVVDGDVVVEENAMYVAHNVLAYHEVVVGQDEPNFQHHLIEEHRLHPIHIADCHTNESTDQ